ncbi:retinaldehyde-binding protein 1-like isoform X2 [Mercenaria mercenaria]|uniref:retinaldehyde-binding protein 1-like isoform X2 n=1 Tax=Mercenaria mercenaria TaxID=6596 RepID=UPI00234E5183|nr:retinaldehyde-binding protein 1-like isoform X2 [Mercenaria mercenaria]
MAVEPGDAKFVSKLNEDGKKKAKEELNELNEKDREIAVQTLRKWAIEQDWLKTPTDFDFLLRFIRVRKYSQLGARETLENYWTNKSKFPEWFKHIDPADKKIQEVIKSGLMLCPRVYDKHGRRVIIGRLSGLDIKMLLSKEGIDTLYRASIMMYDYLSCDENVQVHGLVAISDYTGISMDFLKVWNPENKKKLMGYFQKSLPMRFKGFYLYNQPVFFDAMYAVIAPFMRQKFKDRMHLHGKSLVKIYEEVGMAALPDEYLPDDYDGPSAGSVKQITEEMIEDMMKPEFRNFIIDSSSGKYGVDLEKRKTADKPPEASFRKLNVD